MSGSTRSRKAAADADTKPLSHEEVYSLLNSLRSEVSSLKSARNSDAAEMQLLRLALSTPPPTLSPYPQNQRAVSSEYDRFMQEPYRAADQSNHLLNDGLNFAEWVAGLNRVLCIVFHSELSVDDNPSLLENRSPQENRAISHFINAIIPPDFALCIGVIPACTSSKDFFNAIKAKCCPGNRFQKLKVVRDLLSVLIENGAGQPQSNTTIILTLRRAFAMFKKLGVHTNKLEGLLAQAVCHAPPNVGQVAFDQLVTAAILAKGNEKPSLTFVGQVIMNASQRNVDSGQRPLPFVYHMSDPLAPTMQLPRPHSPFFSKPADQPSDVRRPPQHLVNRFGGSCFNCGPAGHWRADCPATKGFANPNPWPPSPGPSCPIRQGTPERRSQAQPTSHYQRERVSQVKFVECNAADRVLIDTGASIHLSGSHHFATSMQDIPPFRIFFCDSNSSVNISQMTTLKLPVKNGFVIICNVSFSQKISGTILSVGRLCRAGVMPLFNGLSLSLLVSKVLVTTTFANDCWWLDIVPREETSWSAAASSSHCLLEMNPISLPTSVSLSARRWHKCLGHACNKFVISFLKQHVPSFDLKSWQFTYSSAAFLHNRLPNSWCLNSSPHQELFGTAPSIATLYPFGADAIMHIPAVNQLHKLAPRGIKCKLLKPL
ncbi:hypothetical protein O181_076508, partial [Austropuccinia psidii MF-1]|nr:hypothetical protein [Austropuccinia psidii MF-1]